MPLIRNCYFGRWRWNFITSLSSIQPHAFSSGICRCTYRTFRFYADWLPHEVEKLIIEINNSEFQVIEYPLLKLLSDTMIMVMKHVI